MVARAMTLLGNNLQNLVYIFQLLLYRFVNGFFKLMYLRLSLWRTWDHLTQALCVGAASH